MNDNYTRFEYNMIYKYWCFGQLISAFDRIDDIVLITKKTLCQILKIRKFTVPDSVEITDELCDGNKGLYKFINPDGIVFTSTYIKGLGYDLYKFKYVSIDYHFTYRDIFNIIIYYVSQSGDGYYTFVDFDLSRIDKDTMMCNNQIIRGNERYFDGQIYHCPEFIAF